MHPLARFAATFLVVASCVLGTNSVHAQSIGTCLTPADANAAVQSGSIMKLQQVMQIAGVGRQATLHNQRVCFVNNELAYVIDVLNASGSTQQLILRGSDGTPLN